MDDEYLYLDEDGTGYFNLLGNHYSLEWTLDGEDFYFIDESGDEFTGTLAGGVIIGDYYGAYSYIFVKDEVLTPTNAEVEGYYYATACYLDGEDVGVDDEYLYLDDDGTGYFVLLENVYNLEWTLDGVDFYLIDDSGDEFIGTLSGGVIEGDYFGGYSYTFEK